MYAARLLSFGLTAYGDTKLEAQDKLVKMLHSWIHGHERIDTATKVLVRTGLVTTLYRDDNDKLGTWCEMIEPSDGA